MARKKVLQAAIQRSWVAVETLLDKLTRIALGSRPLRDDQGAESPDRRLAPT